MGKAKAKERDKRRRSCGANNNHAYAGQIHYVASVAPPTASKKSAKKPKEATGPIVSPRKSRLHAQDMKVDCLQSYCKWQLVAAKKVDSPIPKLMQTHGCAENYPRRLYKLMMERGTVENQWGLGRPKDYTEEVWDEMVRVIREYRDEEQAYASGASIRMELSKVFTAGTKIPSVRHTNRKKAEMKFEPVNLTYKPYMSAPTMEKRFDYSTKELPKWPWPRTVVIDQKWFTEKKPLKAKVLKRRGAPLKKPFKTKQKETKTQLRKVMYMMAVSPTHGKIGKWKLNWKGHTKINKLTGATEPAGIDTEFMKPYWKKIKTEATRVFQRSDGIRLVLDKAPAHKSKKSTEYILHPDYGDFDEVTLQSPTSPDLNLLDASIFPSLERAMNKRKAFTESEIDAAVKQVWKDLTTEDCKQAAKKVKKNMEATVAIQGGNFYHE